MGGYAGGCRDNQYFGDTAAAAAAAALVVEDTARNVVAPSIAVGTLHCYYHYQTRVLNVAR